MMNMIIKRYMSSGSSLNRKIAIISAHINKGQSKLGVELGPQFIKQEKLYTELRNLDFEPVDYAHISDTYVKNEVKYAKAKHFLSLVQSNRKLSEYVEKAINDGYLPLILGGDHSIAMGSLNGTFNALNKSTCAVIWIDAHADINTPLTSITGNLHGQPLAYHVKELVNYVPKTELTDWIKPTLSARHLVYIGLRDLDPDESYMMKQLNIKAFSMTEIDKKGIENVMKETFQHLTIDGKLLPLHVSVDIDSLDPYYAPSTGTPVLGGLTLRELMQIGNSIHHTGQLKALDLVEVNPLLSNSELDREKTIFSAIRTIISFFGYNTIGTHCKNYVLEKP